MVEKKQQKNIDAFMETMKAYQKTYDFLLYIYPILSGFPKFEKFALQQLHFMNAWELRKRKWKQ